MFYHTWEKDSDMSTVREIKTTYLAVTSMLPVTDPDYIVTLHPWDEEHYWLKAQWKWGRGDHAIIGTVKVADLAHVLFSDAA